MRVFSTRGAGYSCHYHPGMHAWWHLLHLQSLPCRYIDRGNIGVQAGEGDGQTGRCCGTNVKSGDSTFYQECPKGDVWSARGVALTMKIWVAEPEFHGVCPGWVAVMEALPIFRACTVYPSVALPDTVATVLSLL